ncbi:MAG: hypothetical protein AB7V45_17310 [Candidatus Krumholzibacteriia bacterium]
MTEEHFLFEFSSTADMAKVENALLMAVVAAEGIHGRSRVSLEAEFNTNQAVRTCLVNAGNQVGTDIAKVFTEFLNLEVGEDAYKVTRRGNRGGLAAEDNGGRNAS